MTRTVVINRPRRAVLGRVLLLAVLVGLLVVSLAAIASAQPALGVEGVQTEVDLDGAAGVDADGAVEGAVRDVQGVADGAVDLPLDTDPAGGVTSELDPFGLLPGAPAAGPVAVPETQGGPSEPRPLTAQENAVVGGMAAAAGAGFLFWLQSVLGFGGARFFGAPLFSRIEKDELLDNGGRELIMNLVEANPGIGLKELSVQSGLGWGTTVYHASRLEQAGFVASMKKGQNRHFFKNGHPAARMKESVAVLRNETAGSLARFLLGTPGATQTTIARNLGLGAPTVTKYVKRMERQGLVEVVAMGRSKVVQPAVGLQEALAHAMPETALPPVPVASVAEVPMARAVAAGA